MTNENHNHPVTVMATFFQTLHKLQVFMYQCYFVKWAYLENVHNAQYHLTEIGAF